MSETQLRAPTPFLTLLDEAWKSTRRHFVGTYFAVAVPLALAAAALPVAQVVMMRTMHGASNPYMVFPAMAPFVLVWLAFMATHALGYLAWIHAAVDVTEGRVAAMARAWLSAVRPAAIWTLFLLSLAVLIGFVSCCVPGVFLWLLFGLTLPTMAAEGTYGIAALRRSAELAWHNPRRELKSHPMIKILAIILIGVLLAYAVGLTFQLPFGIAQQVLMVRSASQGENVDPETLMAKMMWLNVPSQILGALANAAVNLYVCFATVLLFFDLRRRREGEDIEAELKALAGEKARPIKRVPSPSPTSPLE